MKHKLIPLLTLTLLGALLFTGCEMETGSADETTVQTTPNTTTAKTSAQTTPAVTTTINPYGPLPDPNKIVRPDLIWSGCFSTDTDAVPYPYGNNWNDDEPSKGEIDIRIKFISLYEIPKTDKFAVYFTLFDEYDRDALNAYLINRGLEDTGFVNDMGCAIFAATLDQLQQLDYETLSAAAHVDDPQSGAFILLAKPIVAE